MNMPPAAANESPPSPLPSIRLWLLTKADADAGRALAIEQREPSLAKLLRHDADAARQQAALLAHFPTN